jgi:mannitol/fructose-specific phosphotransferase system IIA component (Ntr-type)
MELSKYLGPESVLILKGRTKGAVLEELARALTGKAKVDFDKLYAAILKREELMSTGIGNGLAIPHVRMGDVPRDGVTDYDSLDKKPVHIIVLIAVPEGQHETYIRLLARATETLHDEQIRRRILEAPNPEELYKILIEGTP